MTSIIIADHHPMTRKGISCLLKKNTEYTIIDKVNNGEEMFKSLRKQLPDILIMEIDMPQVNGITVLRTIKAEFPNLKVLIYSTHPEEIYALRSLKSGASAYVSKTASTKLFTKALKKVAKGGVYLNDELTTTFTS
ncbi:MAG: response regulator transcription factor, partial [Flavobacteriaceae bacterium]|nr:response regulator transcription factor [Flavobacteriaceae bacterium]